MSTIDKLLKEGKDYLDLSVKIKLLAKASFFSESFILSHPEKKVSIKSKLRYRKYKKLASKYIPLDYILQKSSFYGRIFYINQDVLIPRPETELMIDLALKKILSLGQNKQLEIIDLGTGSGVIINTLALELKNKDRDFLKNLKLQAGDISSLALRVAKKNAKYYNLEKDISFKRSNLLKAFLKKRAKGNQKNNLIILANLPYLNSSEIKKEPSLYHEPRLALFGKGDLGLNLYLKLLKSLKKQSYAYLYLIMEINPWQIKPLESEIRANFPKARIEKITDYSREYRFLSLELET